MNSFWATLILFLGLVILWKASDVLVSGAVTLAERMKISPLVVGLTVIAMGTSAPEVAASIAAAVRNAGNTAIGNVYGSNIANLALVGGLIGLIRPVSVQLSALKREIPVMLAAALLLYPVMVNRFLSRPEASALLALFVILIALTIYFARKRPEKPPEIITEVTQEFKKVEEKKAGLLKTSIFFVALGLTGLAVGADMAVRGAVFIGYRIGLSEAVVGLTIIAVGTSLPELATSVAAAIKGHSDISIGNLVGSNIFNTLLVTGAAGTTRPFAINNRLAGTDYWIMVLVAVGFTFAAIAGKRTIGRIAGVALISVYIAYMVYILAFTRAI